MQRGCGRTALQVASICRLAQPREGAAIRLPRKALRTDGSSTAWLAPQVAAGVALELEHVAGMADRQVAMAADMLSRGCCDENALGHGCLDVKPGSGRACAPERPLRVIQRLVLDLTLTALRRIQTLQKWPSCALPRRLSRGWARGRPPAAPSARGAPAPSAAQPSSRCDCLIEPSEPGLS